MVSSGSKATEASKHKMQSRLLQVDMTCSKLLEGLTAIGQTLDGTKASQAPQLSQGGARLGDEMQRIVSDLKRIKMQARQTLSSLEGLDRKVVLKADTVPTRVARLYSSHNQQGREEAQASYRKAPEWTNQLPVFQVISDTN